MTASFMFFVVLWSTFLGACSGGFAGVVEYRAVKGISLTRRSRCPMCGAALKLWETAPIFGWFLVRGRCRTCKAPIPKLDLATEALAGALFGVAAGLFAIGADDALAALQRVGFGLGLAAAGVGFRVLRRIRRSGGAKPRRTDVVGRVLCCAWLLATPLNPLAALAGLPGFDDEKGALMSFVAVSAAWSQFVVLALTPAFERDLGENFNGSQATVKTIASELDGRNGEESSN